VLDSLIFPFDLWKPALVDGHGYQVGGVPLPVYGDQIERREESWGGDLMKYLLPRVVRRERQVNSAAKGSEAWGWLAPPLVGEGAKVQPDWLHDYLLNPTFIRPAVVMRMPQFNMSSREAAILVNYFAARDGVAYPYESESRKSAADLARADTEYRGFLRALRAQGTSVAGPIAPGRRLDDAMRIVTDGNYCV